MFEMPAEDELKFSDSVGKDEKRMYCVPYNFEDDKQVNGYICITDKYIYKLLEGELLAKYKLSEMNDFIAESLYGSCGFYAKINGESILICRFISGRNLPRYSVIVTACEMLAKGEGKEALTSNEPERFCPKCGRPFVVHTKICPFCQSKKDVYKKLWAMTKGLRLMMLFPLIAAIISIIFRFIIPYIQRIAIDNYIIPATGIQSGTFKGFILIVVAIITLDIVHRTISVIQGRMAAVSGNRFVRMLRALLFEKIQMLSMSSIQKKSTGDLMGRINQDVAVVQSFITSQMPSYVAMFFSFILALSLLIYLNPLMCLFVFIPLPLAIFCILKFKNIMQRRNIRAWILGQRTNRNLQDVLNGIRVVKAYGNEEDAVEKFVTCTKNQAKQDESNAKTFDTFFPIIGFIIHLGKYFIIMYGNILLFGGRMLVGELSQFNSYANIIYEPLLQITSIPRNISNFLTSLGKVLEILEEEPDVADCAMPINQKIVGNISINHVTFGYDSYNPVLKDISLNIKQGEMIGLVGHSGCGKTTLINLLMRLYDATEGEILVDGINIKDFAQNSLRSQIGVVLQETHLFSGSIRDNIKYSSPHATNAEVINAAREANAHDFIIGLPEGYNTMVGEKGYSLSGGERQRIAIARALIHNPKILILDEATAALDTETEKLIQDAINKVTAGRTTFAIAHRLSTLRNADKLIVLDHGELAEFGTHRELLDRKGIYYKLVMAQKRAELAKQNAV